ncbi:MAG: hypothetical protein NC217_08460 [Muribaculaceae bacterium]|nr:hypothetical protein [Muribaculaceae bacterium]
MKMFNNTDDDDRDDLYDKMQEIEPPKPKEPKVPKDDPQYWDRDEGEWDHLIPGTRRRKLLIWGGSALAIVLALGLLAVWLCSPYVQDAVQYGYVDHVEERGNLFKTYEGNLIPYKSMHDTTRMLEKDFIFSTSSKLGRTLRSYQNSGRPLRVEYRTYRYAMPWRGDSRTVIIRVDTVSPDSILPLPVRR